MVEYDIGELPEYSRQEWDTDKKKLNLEFASLPYFIDGNTKLTDAIAIQKYISRKWAPYLMGHSPEERAHVIMVSAIISDLKEPIT